MVYELYLNKAILFENVSKITSQLSRKSHFSMGKIVRADCLELGQLSVWGGPTRSTHSEILVELTWFLPNSLSLSVGCSVSLMLDHSDSRY